MKQLIGSDVGKYIFSPLDGTVALVGLPPVGLENILVITNVSRGVMLYNFADPALGGSITENVLSLEIDTTAHGAEDTLQIWIDLPRVDQLEQLLRRLLDAAMSPAGYDSAQNRGRMTAVVESGTITTVTTCTTCGTVSNLAQIDGRNGAMLINAADNCAWQQAIRSRIS